MADNAILFDTTRCSACRGCQVACKEWNEHEATVTEFNGSYENPKTLSSNTWVRMRFTEVERQGKLSFLFTRNSCMHCTDASCATVCPVKAITKTAEGFVHIDQEWCIGCGTCTEACPFHIPHLDHHEGTATKCQACTSVGLNRLQAGAEPACVKACPPDALIYGNRDDLVTTGQKRVAALKNKGHVNAYLYGENELDGLHVMYVLDDNPSVYGLPENPQPASSDMVEKWLAGLVTAGAVATLPLLWVIRRREEMQNKAKAEGGAK
jgi:formate dehydrogenase iron-sulfur subunit